MLTITRLGISTLLLFPLLTLIPPLHAAEGTPPSMQSIFSRMDRVTVIKTSDVVFIRTPWNDTQDVLQTMILNTPAVYDNNPVNFGSGALIPIATPDNAAPAAANASTMRLGYGQDDACPANYNNGYVGANHGACYTVKVTTPAAHGKTVEDVGSEWLDGGKHKWYLARVIDDTNMWFVSENLTPGGIWSFATTITGNKLTHSAKAAHTGDISISARQLTQLEPMTQNRNYKVLLDGATEITADGVYTCKYVDVVNTYDISNLASVVDYLKAHAGSSTQPIFNDPSIASDMRFCITYRYIGNGSVTVYHTVRTYKDVALGYVGFMQAAPLYTQSGSRLWQYIPKTKPVAGKLKTWNFQAMENITGAVETLNIERSSWTDADNPPERFAQLVKTAEGVTSHGFLVGYSQLRGIGIPAARKTLVSNAFSLYVSRKQYPHGIDNGMTGLVDGRLPADSYFEAVGYRCWINPAIDPDATVCTWYMDGSDIVLVLDYHKNLKMHQVTLPAQFTGKTVTAVDVSASTTVHSKIISQDGLLISVTGGYGYAVLRLS